MKKIILLLLFINFSTAISFGQNNKATVNKQQVQTTEVFYVDVRTPAEFAQGSAKNAINIPLDELEKEMAQFKGKKKVVVFCRSGARSGKAKSILEANGILNVSNGGSWQEVDASLKK